MLVLRGLLNHIVVEINKFHVIAMLRFGVFRIRVNVLVLLIQEVVLVFADLEAFRGDVLRVSEGVPFLCLALKRLPAQGLEVVLVYHVLHLWRLVGEEAVAGQVGDLSAGVAVGVDCAIVLRVDDAVANLAEFLLGREL